MTCTTHPGKKAASKPDAATAHHIGYYLWLEGDEGNVEHLAEHGLTIEDVEHVIESFREERVSRSSGRPIRFGYTADGRYIAVVFE